MDKETELGIVRRAFAKQILAAAGVADRRMEDAYAHVRREHFLAPGPWHIFRWLAGIDLPTPDADPVYVYTNDVIEIDPQRRINNGEPAFHAKLIAAALPAPGEHVVHVGTGLGYYTAILACLVGPSRASQFVGGAPCGNHARRRYDDRFRDGGRHLRERRRDLSAGPMAGPARGRRPVDPAADRGTRRHRRKKCPGGIRKRCRVQN